MEPYIQISLLNDFIFCPRSIYFHQLCATSSTKFYHTHYQTAGLNSHKSIDEQGYSTSTAVLQGIDVFSEKYRLCGKIDTYDSEKKILSERKKKIKVIYEGYVFQLYAQYYCLIEMGYTVNHIKLHSMDDNKNYALSLPEKDKQMNNKFEKLIHDMQSFDLQSPFFPNMSKCAKCIYSPLCDYALVD